MNPVLTIAIEPKNPADLHALLDLLGGEFVVVATDPAIVIGGFDEVQLDDTVSLIARQVAIRVHSPQIAYRETITRPVDHDYTHKTQKPGQIPEFARIKFRIEPTEPGMGVHILNQVVGALLGDHILGAEAGFKSACERGRMFPVTDVRVILTDGAYHDKDSSILSFRHAAEGGFVDAFAKAHPVFLEPIMRVEVVTPEIFLGPVIDDLNARRGQVRRVEPHGTAQVISAMVPFSNMLGYTSSLRSLAGSQGAFSIAFDRYERVPDGIFDPDDRFRPAMAMRA